MEIGQDPFVYVIGKDIYVSPNVQRGPTSTELERLGVSFSDPLLPTDAMHMRYASNRFPYLAFTIPQARYKSTILKPLDHSRYTLPIKMIGGQYCLEPTVAASWAELETNLGILASKLLAHYTPHVDVEFETFPLPGDYGYHNGRHTEDGMRRAAMRARKAFAPLIALCSYAIAMTPRFNEPAPEWVMWGSRVHTLVGSRSYAAPPLWISQSTGAAPANVPVWLLWNKQDDYQGTPCAVYRPSLIAVDLAKLRARQITSSNLSPRSCALLDHGQVDMETQVHSEQPAIGPSVDKFPDPEPLSGQRKGETLHEFTERRNKEDLARAERETPEQRAARMQKVAAATKFSLPGRSGAKVFEWEAEGQHWIRKAMSRGYVEQQWGSIPQGQLRYNSFRNEWDYCELFDPNAEAVVDDDFDDTIHDYNHGSEVLDDAPLDPPRRRRGADAIPASSAVFLNEYLRRAYDDVPNGDQLSTPEPMDVILRSRYGFCGNSEPGLVQDDNWHWARKTLSDTESAWLWPELKSQVCNFLCTAVANDVPPELWDLDMLSPSRLTFFNDQLVVERVTNGTLVSYRIAPRTQATGEDKLWDLIVPDAITAVECLRRSHALSSKASIVEFFAHTGRPFSTRKPIDPPPPPTLAPRLRSYYPDGLSERDASYSPDLLDYRGYERDRSAFLLSDRGRAAMREGGIIWRLAVQHLRLEDVLGGPVDLAAAMYERFDGEQVGGWDDELTDNERNLMCGVYRIITGPGAYQLSDASWWPKSSTWNNSCLNVRYWTHTCETWFQRRMESIRDGSAGVKSASKWKEALKLHKPATALVKTTCEKCEEVLTP